MGAGEHDPLGFLITLKMHACRAHAWLFSDRPCLFSQGWIMPFWMKRRSARQDHRGISQEQECVQAPDVTSEHPSWLCIAANRNKICRLLALPGQFPSARRNDGDLAKNTWHRGGPWRRCSGVASKTSWSESLRVATMIGPSLSGMASPRFTIVCTYMGQRLSFLSAWPM